MKMKHRITVSVCCVMLAVLSLPLPPLSASELLRIDTIQMAPLGFFTEDGKSAGFFYDLANRIAEEAGFSYQNRIVPFARMINEIESGEADVSIFYRSEKNDKLTIPISALFSLKNIIIGGKGTKFDSVQSLHGKKVARVRGARYDESFDSDPAIKMIETVDYKDSLRMLVHQIADAAVMPETGFLFTVKQTGYSKADFGEPLVLNTKEAWLQFSETAADDKKISALKTAAEKVLKDETIQSLLRKYTGD